LTNVFFSIRNICFCLNTGVTCQESYSICPDGVQQITLLPEQANAAEKTPTDASALPVGAASQFAVPLQFSESSSPLSPNNSGTWLEATSDTKNPSWRLCFIAPAAPETFSLTTIFSKLQLPLNSRVELETHFRGEHAVKQQVFHPWDLTGGKIASVPLEGDVLLVTYWPPPPPALSSPSSSFALEIEAVLQGTRSLPFSFGTSTTRTTTADAASYARSSEGEQTKEDQITIDNTGTSTDPSSSGLPPDSPFTGDETESDSPYIGDDTEPDSPFTGDETEPSEDQSPPPSPTNVTITGLQAARVANRSGSALTCLPDAGCFPEWQNATQATVLLVLISPLGGRFCTGTLLASPPSPSTTYTSLNSTSTENSTISSETSGMDQQLILTANHCRKTDDEYTIYNMWGVVFDYGNACKDRGGNSDTVGTSNGSSDSDSDRNSEAGAANKKDLTETLPSKILQGLEVVYSDEISDILILRVLSEIPETFDTFFLGWDVSTFPGSSGTSSSTSQGSGSRRNRNFLGGSTNDVVTYGTVHYAAGDTKKLTNTSSPLRPSKWKSQQNTHVTSRWSSGGVTQEGSSGAALVDTSTGLAVGVLTGGPEPDTCADGKDILGTLYAAYWGRDLWKILSPGATGPVKNQKMQGVSPMKDGPGIVAAPAYIALQERDVPVAAAAVKLSDPPAAGETITIKASLFLPPQTVELIKNVAAASNDASSTASISLIEPTQFTFTSEDWNISQRIGIDPGSDTTATGPLPFQIILELSSDATPTLKKRRVLKGIRADEELPSGLTIEDPVIVESGPYGIQARDTVTLLAASNSDSGEVKLGDVLTDAGPPGSVYFYNVSSGDTVQLNIVACGADAPLQVAIYNSSIATW
jgi:hypothetical protein